jgi:uncharacterized protein YqeY
MSIPETISAQLKDAMRARDTARLSALRMIKAALLEAEKKTGRSPGDDDCVAVLRRMRKQREDAAIQYREAGRQELAEGEEGEILVIDGFLPQLADADTTRAWVREAIDSSGATATNQLGMAMGALMKAHKGEVDGGLARSILQEELS